MKCYKFKHITDLIRKEEVTLFAGAGFSLNAGAPSCSDIISSIKEELTEQELNKIPKSKAYDLAYISDFFISSRSGGKNQLIRLLSNLMRFDRNDLTVHQQLAHIPHFHNIITTNYDTLIEDAFNQYGMGCQVIRNDKDCTQIDNTLPSIFKIHGDMSTPDNLIISTSDYNGYFNNRKNPNMWDLIKSQVLTDNILFIGYSIKDSNILDIIRRVSEAVGDNRKSFFMVAPGCNKADRKRIKVLGVEYFDSTAKDFFEELDDVLCENIVKDVRKKKVSERTFQSYCSWHNIEPIIHLKSKENVINGFHAANGIPIDTKINFTVRNQSTNLDDFLDFAKRGAFYPNLPDGHSASLAIKLDKDSLTELNCYENGIRILDLEEVESLYIQPYSYTGQLTIEAPALNFIELVDFTSYKLNANTVLIPLNLDAFKLDITLTFNKGKQPSASLKLHISPNETYTNGEVAIKWATFFNSIFDGEDFYFKEISKLPINVSSSDISSLNIKDLYKDFITYYADVKKLEILLHTKFKKYYNYDEDKAPILKAIIAYKTRQPVITYTPKGYDFEFIMNDFQSKESKEFLESGGPYVLAYSNFPLTDITFNDVLFKIPYKNTVLANCTIKDFVRREDNSAKMIVHNNDSSYISYYSDDPIKNNGNEIQVSPLLEE